MLKLNVGVKTICVKSGGSVNAVRRKIDDDPSVLNGKKVVIWEFAARFLRSDETPAWEKIPLAETRPATRAVQ
jgi:hypothetical protein